MLSVNHIIVGLHDRAGANFSAVGVLSKEVLTREFLPRDAMDKRCLCRQSCSVCLSVHPPVMFVYSVKRNKHILETFFAIG